MTHNFGTDLIITRDGDLTTSANGDWLDTDTYQSLNSSLYTFEGEVCVREVLYRVISYEAGDYSIFDITTGAGAEALISKSNFASDFELFKERVERQLQRDDRIDYIEDIFYEKVDANIFKVGIKIKMVGKDKLSSFVFPFVRN